MKTAVNISESYTMLHAAKWLTGTQVSHEGKPERICITRFYVYKIQNMQKYFKKYCFFTEGHT